MHPNQSKRFAGRQLMLAAILLLACVVLLVGTTLARYRTDEVGYLGYAVEETGTIFLQTDGWVFSENSGSLSFTVSNSADGTDYPQAAQTVSVRLLASLSIAEIEGVSVQLNTPDGTYTAIPVSIQEGTALYKTFGAGRVYRFYKDNTELSWPLAGGTVSTLSGQLVIDGLSKPENPALLQLQAVGG